VPPLEQHPMTPQGYRVSSLTPSPNTPEARPPPSHDRTFATAKCAKRGFIKNIWGRGGGGQLIFRTQIICRKILSGERRLLSRSGG
jgi:hypothetical protein